MTGSGEVDVGSRGGEGWWIASYIQFSSSLSHVRLFETPWTAGCKASPSITNSWSLLKLMSIELVMPSNHLILCHPLLLLPSVFPSIRVFSNEPTDRFQILFGIFFISCDTGVLGDYCIIFK